MTELLAALIILTLVALVWVEWARRKALLRLRHGSLHDSVTDLPNRSLFEARLGKALARARRHGYMVAVLFVDVNRFRVVNESLGHEGGDRLLRSLGERIEACLREEDTLARFGADEFTVLLEHVDGADAAARVAERVIDAVGEPFLLEDQHVVVGLGIGIATAVDGGAAPEGLLRDADVAMRRAKESGRQYEVFDSVMGDRARRRLALEAELGRAIEEGQVVAHFQPQVDLATGEVVGVEALARWDHPSGELLPGEFIPAAERTGLIEPLGRAILEQACAWGARLVRANGRRPLRMSVNISGLQLRNGRRLIHHVVSAAERTGFPLGLLVLEVTETELVREGESAASALRQLRELGVNVAIDDFGTGYSSLAYLRYLPVGMLKLDRSFIRQLVDAGDDRIVRWMIELAGSLDMRVCAEGVETVGQLEALRSLGCDMAQGYLFARPVPAARVDETIRAVHATLADLPAPTERVRRIQGA